MIVLVSLIGLASLLFSDELRRRMQRFVIVNFRRPRFDYRKEWTGFTERTASLTDSRALAQTVTQIISETLGVSAVTLWATDGAGASHVLGGSTIVSDADLRDLPEVVEAAGAFCRAARDRDKLFELDPETAGVSAASWYEFTRVTEARRALPLAAAGRMVGVLMLGPRVGDESFSLEDVDLLRTVADQAAASLLSLELSQRVARAREIEAFQTVSTFFVHDLKNLAAMLSLTVQNLPANFDDPEFRADALRVIGDSVEKMKGMCSRLSTLTRDLELEPVDGDLNVVVATTLAELDGAVGFPITRELAPLPRIKIDAEQMGKVVVNLVLNACDAVNGHGWIRVTTQQRSDGTVELAVADGGCGMSREFVEKSLFLPFRTTKSRGMGIGLFQSRRIVEAHRGRVEVESEEGKGSVFRIVLPAVG